MMRNPEAQSLNKAEPPKKNFAPRGSPSFVLADPMVQAGLSRPVVALSLDRVGSSGSGTQDSASSDSKNFRGSFRVHGPWGFS